MSELLSIMPFDGFRVEKVGENSHLFRDGFNGLLSSVAFGDEKSAIFASHVIAQWFDLDAGVGLLKCPPFVSPKLRYFAKGQDCALFMPWCNRNPETTVHCHIRAFGSGGTGSKPHDFLGYHGCSECHRREKEAGWDDILRALMITQTRIYAHFGTLTP